MADPIPRRDYIALIMHKQGVQRHPRKFIVLQGWDTIVDHDVTYTVKLPTVPPLCKGLDVYVIANPDTPDLTRAKVVEDQGADGLWVQPYDNESGVQFLVPREDVKMLPIPLRPHAILRADLKVYIGDDAAEAWHEQRRARRDRPAAQE